MWIYIHIPFCTAICDYCHNNRDKWNQDDVNKYFELLIRKIKSKKNIFNGLKIKTIYFWWGTPSLLSWKQFQSIIDELKGIFVFSKNTFINIETTPFSLDYDKLKLLDKIWINRISVWIQSTSWKVLWGVNRAWDYEFTLKTLKNIKSFKNIELNIDFIAGLPNEKEDDLTKNIKLIEEINPNTLFVYKYKPHDKTPFFESGWRFIAKDFKKIELHHSIMSKELFNIWYSNVKWNIECFSNNENNKLNLHDFNYFNYQNSVISFWKYSEWHIFWKMFFRCTSFWEKSSYEWFNSSLIDEKIRYVYNSINSYWYIDIKKYEFIFKEKINKAFNHALKIISLLKSSNEKDWKIFFRFDTKKKKNMSLALFFDKNIIDLLYKKIMNKNNV